MKGAKDKNTLKQKKSAQRKSYHSPKLSNFGTVAQLTLATKNNALDDSGMNMMSS
jgi:hypothetical protein